MAGAITVSLEPLEEFAAALLAAVGTPEDIAAEVAHHLVAADSAGHASHGIIHLPTYLAQAEAGEIVAAARPSVTRETETSAFVDGNWGFGHHATKFATLLGVQKALERGLSAVAVGRTGHIGRLGEYTEVAARHDCVLLMVTAPIPGNQVVPPGGAEGVLGTNPISIGFPRGDTEPFCLDFATSAISGGKVWLAEQKGEQIPADVLLTADMQPTSDPAWLRRGAIFPAFGGHKGYALSIAIALLAGTLTGAGGVGERPVQAGTLLVTLSAGLFADADSVAAAANQELDRIKHSRRLPATDEIVLPGEPEQKARARAARGGVEVTGPTRDRLTEFATRLGVNAAVLDS